MLISLRAIAPSDKAASLTLTVSLLSLLAFLPSPIVFGAVVDAACTVWGERCGERTNCLVYDSDSLRVNLGLMATAAMVLATACDFAIWLVIGDLDLYDEGEEKKDGERDDEQRVSQWDES